MRSSKWSTISWFLWDGLVSMLQGKGEKEQSRGGMNVRGSFDWEKFKDEEDEDEAERQRRGGH